MSYEKEIVSGRNIYEIKSEIFDSLTGSTMERLVKLDNIVDSIYTNIELLRFSKVDYEHYKKDYETYKKRTEYLSEILNGELGRLIKQFVENPDDKEQIGTEIKTYIGDDNKYGLRVLDESINVFYYGEWSLDRLFYHSTFDMDNDLDLQKSYMQDYHKRFLTAKHNIEYLINRIGEDISDELLFGSNKNSYFTSNLDYKLNDSNLNDYKRRDYE